jgi:L-ascorbate metabolism protein UlaG (beta-lactamase superfamily)
MRLSVVALGALLLAGCAGVGTEPLPGQPAHHVDGGFRNTDPGVGRPDAWTRWSFLARRVWASIASPRTFELPRVGNDGQALRARVANPSVTWVGHSTLLVQLDGLNILTDPHWGERASPLSWAGPKRMSAPGLAFENLPEIHVVLISHDHYDHLDLGTVQRLAKAHNPLFLVPLRMKEWFRDNGMLRVVELDWWQIHGFGGVEFVGLPAQHFSQRTPWDRDRRLWASWGVIGKKRRLYFGGDTGYFSGFKEIGERYGPFDLAAIAIGAYLPPEIMRFSHTTPEQTVQAFEDVKGRVLLGIHWGTFDLAEEPLEDPPTRMLADARRRGIDPNRTWIMKIGETREW